MKYHGAGGKVRNRGLVKVGTVLARRLCSKQSKTIRDGFKGREGLVSVRSYGNKSGHVRCYPIVRKNGANNKKSKSAKKNSAVKEVQKKCSLLKKDDCKSRDDCMIGKRSRKCKARK